MLVSSAKIKTPGTYIHFGEEKRAFYCLGEDGVFQDFQFNEKEDEWNQGSLAKAGVTPTVGAGIAAVGTSDGKIHVFFQRNADDKTIVGQDSSRGQGLSRFGR